MIFACSLSGASPESEPTNLSRNLGLAANNRIIWVYQHQVGEDGQHLVRFGYQLYGGSFKSRFWGGPIVTGVVVVAAIRGEDIHAIFGDGTHRRFAPLRFGPTPTTAPTARELNLPDNALPMALTADDKRGLVYAVVTDRVAEKIILDRRLRLERQQGYERDDDDGGPPIESQGARSTDEKAPHDASVVPGFCAVVRYERGYWWVDRPGPEVLTADHQPGALVAVDDHQFLITIDSTGVSPILTLWESSRSDERFEQRGSTRLSDSLRSLTLATCGDDLCLGVILDDNGRATAQIMRWVDGAWTAPLALTQEGGQPLALPSTSAVAFAGDKVVLAVADGPAVPSVGLWSIETGAPVATPVSADVLARSEQPTLAPGARQFLHYAVLGALVAIVFVWRRDRVATFAPLQSNQQPARLERRMLAAVVDVGILGPIWVPLVFALWRSGASDMTVAEQLMYRQPQQSSPLFWAGAMIGAVYALYGAILELALGHTLGKRVTGCTVVGEGGARCTVGAILIRNAARVVEFHFLPVALLVALTPSRQRLGDMLARTVVIEHVAGPPALDELVDDESGESSSENDNKHPS